MIENFLKRSARFIQNKIMTDETFTIKAYQNKFGKRPDLNDPQTLSEKINALKLSKESYKLANYVDKYEVRKFVEDTIGEDYLVPLYGVYPEFNKKIFESLPSSFIIKGTHGCDMTYIVKDKSKVQFEDIDKNAKKWLKQNYYKKGREKQYRYIKRRIIAEELMLENDESPTDYKFFCFHGEPLFLSVIYSRFNNYSKNVYDMKGNQIPVTIHGVPNKIGVPLDIDLKAFLEPVRKLASPFTFVRVDMYNYKGKPKFGELTFHPYNGKGYFNPESYDLEFGKMLELNDKRSSFKL